MSPKAAKPIDPTAFKRDDAGIYRSGDGRFTIEQASGRWLVLDAEQQDDLGLPLVRGPYDTLAAARAGAEAARSGPAPASDLPARLADRARGRPPAGANASGHAHSGPKPKGREAATKEPDAPTRKPPSLEIRRYGSGDGAAMRALWTQIGLKSIGDDDHSLDLLAERNPGLVLVATQGDLIVGTALGAWDGRRGWIYHVGTAPDHRGAGLGKRLVHEVERKLRALGCPKVNVVVRDENADGAAFWEALGYRLKPARQYGRDL